MSELIKRNDIKKILKEIFIEKGFTSDLDGGLFSPSVLNINGKRLILSSFNEYEMKSSEFYLKTIEELDKEIISINFIKYLKQALEYHKRTFLSAQYGTGDKMQELFGHLRPISRTFSYIFKEVEKNSIINYDTLNQLKKVLFDYNNFLKTI